MCAVEAASDMFKSLLDKNDTPLNIKTLISTSPIVVTKHKFVEKVKKKISVLGIDRVFLEY